MLDVDYGRIPGTSENTLLKPGAEKLTSFFGLSPSFSVEEKEIDWTGEEHSGEPFFYFQYRCRLLRGDLMVGDGLGSCVIHDLILLTSIPKALSRVIRVLV